MENASKALMIAATVLLGIFLLTAMIYLFRAGGKVSKAYDDKQINAQLEAYNAKFEFFDSRENTITDVISLINLIYSTNEESEYSYGYAVGLDIDCGGIIYSIPTDKELTERNRIFKGTDEIEIYSLLNAPVKDIANASHVKIYGENSGTVNDSDTLSLTRLNEKNKTIYKYIFACESGDEFTYYDNTTRVKYIKLKLYINPDY